MSSIRILLVDDHKYWRNYVRWLLQGRPEWQLVCEVSDGLEAVQKAEELKPDLILLDIGLPNLNGIKAARRIQQLSPNSKIVFLSADNSLEVVQEALSTGAQGYIYKARAQSDLLLAIDTLQRGRKFVSILEGYETPDSAGAKAPHCHEVLFYSDDAFFLDSFARFIAAGLEAGNVVIALATEPHRDGLARRLKARGLDIEAALRQRRYIPLDVAKTLSTFMVDGMPDPDRFFEVVGDLIRAAKREHPRVVACGECAPFLWAEGKTDAAIQVEQLWDQIVTLYGVDTLCGYGLSSFHGEENKRIFQSICAEHSAVFCA